MALLSRQRQAQIVKWSLIVAVILGLVRYGGIKYIGYKTYKGMSGEERAAFDYWLTQKVAFPDEAFQAATVSEETLQLARECLALAEERSQQIRALVGDIRKTSASQTTQPVEQMQAQLAAARPFLDLWVRVVTRDDYTMDVWSIAVEFADFPATEIFMNPVKIFEHDSVLAVERGDFTTAMAQAEALVMAARLHPYSQEVWRIFGIAAFKRGLDVWQSIVEHAEDEAVLRKAQERVIAYRQILPEFPSRQDLPVRDSVGTLRTYAMRGMKVDRLPKTGFGWMSLMHAAIQQDGPNNSQKPVKQMVDVADRFPEWKAKAIASILYRVAYEGRYEENKKRHDELMAQYQAACGEVSEKIERFNGG